jgi:two-component system chemotaxis response regulator CheB
MNKKKTIRVLIIDDSALARNIIRHILDSDPEIEVIATASDPYIARDKIIKLQPDVLTLDVEMPKMDGVEFLHKLMPQHPIPTIMVSALTEKGKLITLKALETGAIDFVLKPKSNVVDSLEKMSNELCAKVKMASKVDVSNWKGKWDVLKRFSAASSASSALAESTDKVIAIGASTGGTEAIRDVLTHLPANIPGIVIVQHMPAGFTRLFSDRMNGACEINVKEAEDGDRILRGWAFIAPGDRHMRVERSGGIYKIRLGNKNEDFSCGHKPSVEVMMNSVATSVGANAIGVMLTGMGADGAGGMKKMREAGARTFAQDEKTSVVFGMPMEAYRCGGAEMLVPLGDIARKLITLTISTPK